MKYIIIPLNNNNNKKKNNISYVHITHNELTLLFSLFEYYSFIESIYFQLLIAIRTFSIFIRLINFNRMLNVELEFCVIEFRTCRIKHNKYLLLLLFYEFMI